MSDDGVGNVSTDPSVDLEGELIWVLELGRKVKTYEERRRWDVGEEQTGLERGHVRDEDFDQEQD